MKPRRPPAGPILRRRVRESQWIETPDIESQPPVPSMRVRAGRTTVILLAFVVAGAAVLATPLATRTGERTPPVDAVFTSMSAVTVTGLVTVDTELHWNILGQLIILALIQIGGLGFMVGASVLFQLSRRQRTTIRQSLFLSDGSPSTALHEASSLSRQIAIFTVVTETAGWVVLTIYFWREMPLVTAVWHGLFHAISAFCNAGFDLQGNFQSFTGDNRKESVVVSGVVMLLIQAGSLSYLVLKDVFLSLLKVQTGQSRLRLSLESKIVLSGNFLLLAVAFISMLLVEWNGMLKEFSTGGRFLAASFQAVSVRTAGFSTVDFGEASSVTEFVWLALMLIGGVSGSAAGGVKIGTMALVVVAVLSTFRGETETMVFRRRVPMPLVLRAMTIIAGFLFLHFTATLLLASSEIFVRGHDGNLIDILFETMSALATVGLSTGITPDLTTIGKIVLIVTMFTGRLGPLTLGYALQLRSQPRSYRYPTEDIRLG